MFGLSEIRVSLESRRCKARLTDSVIKLDASPVRAGQSLPPMLRCACDMIEWRALYVRTRQVVYASGVSRFGVSVVGGGAYSIVPLIPRPSGPMTPCARARRR